MVLSKYDLPNGNRIIWLGKGGIWGEGEKDDINNVLILAGGEVLLLKTILTLPLYEERIQKDILTLSFEAFVNKYNLPNNQELWAELKDDVKSGKYSLPK